MSSEEQWLLKEKYNGEKTEGFFTDCQRLQNNEPLAYIIGHVPFLGATIHLDSRPLIPRAETEFWVAKAIEEIQHMGIEYPQILDLCAGSGCIGVAVGMKIPSATIHFAEIDEAHHPTIRKNVAANSITMNHQVFGGDLFEKTQPPYAFIFANPPYIRTGSEHVQRSVMDYEPHLALFGGSNGTDYIEKIIAEAAKMLAKNGVLYIEHEPEHAQAIAKLAEAHGLRAATHTDQYGRARYSRLHVAQ